MLHHLAMQRMSSSSSCQGFAFLQCSTPTNTFHSITMHSRIHMNEKQKEFYQFSLHSFRITERRSKFRPVTGSLSIEDAVTRSGTTARERRIEKLKEERRVREIEKENKKKEYPEWAKVIEEACKHDAELRETIGDAIGNPELMSKRLAERGKKKGRDISQPKSGSLLAVNVIFKDFNPTDSYIWIELYGSASDKDVDLLGGTIRSWYVLGRLGGFNSANLQLTDLRKSGTLRYNVEHASKALVSSFHDISDVEFQDNLARFWVDMGTSDVLALDILINALMGLSADFVGIKHLVFGGKRFGDWEEGMKSAEFGYKKFKI